MRVVCTPAPSIEKLSLHDIKFLLAKHGQENVLGLSAESYAKASENDRAKFKQTMFFGLIALHYLDCINIHNKTIE